MVKLSNCGLTLNVYVYKIRTIHLVGPVEKIIHAETWLSAYSYYIIKPHRKNNFGNKPKWIIFV